MSVQNEIDRIIGLVSDSHEKVKARGGETAEPYLLANLPGAIESIPKGVELPKLTNPASASDIVKGKEAIGADGNVITGEVLAVNAFNTSMNASGMSVNGTDLVMTSHQYGSFMLNAGSDIVFKTPLNLFGDAAASDVAKGKTFTSAAGLLVEGTHECEGGVTLPEGAVVVQKVLAAQASQQISSGYSLSVTYGDNVEINDSIALDFTGTTKNLSNISNTTDFSVLSGKYVRTGSSYGTTTGTIYYIPDGATFTVGGQSMNKTLTCDKAQKVSMKKVSV